MSKSPPKHKLNDKKQYIEVLMEEEALAEINWTLVKVSEKWILLV